MIHNQRIYQIIIRGERNTGTHWLHSLCRENIKNVKIGNKAYLWKHGFFLGKEPKKTTHLILVITKDVYAWVYSLYKRPYHVKRTSNLNHFIRRPYQSFCTTKWFVKHMKQTMYKELTFEKKPNGKLYENIIQLRNAKHRQWLSLRGERKVEFIKYEDLFATPEKVIDTICQKYKLQTKRFTNKMGWRSQWSSPKTYKENDPKARFNKKQIQFIAAENDWETEALIDQIAIK